MTNQTRISEGLTISRGTAFAAIGAAAVVGSLAGAMLIKPKKTVAVTATVAAPIKADSLPSFAPNLPPQVTIINKQQSPLPLPETLATPRSDKEPAPAPRSAKAKTPVHRASLKDTPPPRQHGPRVQASLESCFEAISLTGHGNQGWGCLHLGPNRYRPTTLNNALKSSLLETFAYEGRDGIRYFWTQATCRRETPNLAAWRNDPATSWLCKPGELTITGQTVTMYYPDLRPAPPVEEPAYTGEEEPYPYSYNYNPYRGYIGDYYRPSYRTRSYETDTREHKHHRGYHHHDRYIPSTSDRPYRPGRNHYDNHHSDNSPNYRHIPSTSDRPYSPSHGYSSDRPGRNSGSYGYTRHRSGTSLGTPRNFRGYNHSYGGGQRSGGSYRSGGSPNFGSHRSGGFAGPRGGGGRPSGHIGGGGGGGGGRGGHHGSDRRR